MVSVLHSSVWIALVTSAAGLAAPPAPAPAPIPATQAALPGAPGSLEHRIALASRFVALTTSPDSYLDGIKGGYIGAALEDAGDSPPDGFMDKVVKDADFFAAKLEPQVRKRYATLADAFAKAYAREFTSAELEQMVAFAGSPAGQHFLEEGLTIVQDPAVIAVQQLIMEEIQPAMDELRRKSCAKRAAQRIAAGDAKAKCPLAQQSAAG